ncbi:MAG: caspase family protein [Burkholderiales bacterium]
MEQNIVQAHAQKMAAVEKAVRILEQNPTIADLKPCAAGGGGGDCIAARPATPVADSGRGLPVPKVAYLPAIQKKVALLIGVSDYQGTIPKLASPVKDVTEIGKIYKEQLGYEVRTLPNADKATIVRALNRLILESGSNDSVTVMYAGHGHVVEKTNRGYWIPAKASADDPTQWISNQDVAKALENIPAKQIMLVSDSCYSGSLTREGKVEKGAVLANPQDVLGKRSVTLLSSGGEEPVPDQGKDGHSVFAWHFMQTLKEVKNVEKGVDLFQKLSDSVKADIPQTPQYGEGLSSGHQVGGDYLFEARKY